MNNVPKGGEAAEINEDEASVVTPLSVAHANQFDENPGSIDEINFTDPALALRIDALDHLSLGQLDEFLQAEPGVTEAHTSMTAYGALYPNLTVVFLTTGGGKDVRAVMPLNDGEVTQLYRDYAREFTFYDLDHRGENEVAGEIQKVGGRATTVLAFREKGDEGGEE